MNEYSKVDVSVKGNARGRSGKRAQRSMLAWMHKIAWAEGLSFLLLLFIAVPMKRLGDDDTLVRILGPIHGGLFLLYVATAIMASRVLKWPWWKLAQALVASVLPFGPFIFEARLQRQRELIELAESY